MTQQNSCYEYSKITQPGIIRLILLEPSESLEAELNCSLINGSLKFYENDVIEHYVTLSYVWGDASQKGSINVDGKALEITASLEVALRHVRDRSRIIRIWADGVCINQNDVEDRNTQVSVMGSIYATARHTIIFLGPSNPRYCAVLNTIVNLNGSEELEAHDTPNTLPDDIIKHPWFTRVWVLQELVLSSNPWVQSGLVRVRWDLFWQHMATKTSEAWSHHQNTLHSMGQIRAKWHARKHDMEQPDRTGGILEILEARRGLGVSDPRDMVYAHLGLSSVSIRSNVIINYSKSTAQVYEDLARSIYELTKNFAILPYVQSFDLDTCLDLPSWVPNWSLPFNMNPHDAFRPAFHLLSAENSRDWDARYIKPQETPGVLLAQGVLHGTVVHILPRTLSNLSDGEQDKAWIILIQRPEIWNLIKVMLTISAYNYDKDISEYVERYLHSPLDFFLSDSYLKIMSKIVADLPLETQKVLETASINLSLLFKFLGIAICWIIPEEITKLKPGENAVLIQCERRMSILKVPEQTCVGDIVARVAHDPNRRNYFVFRRQNNESVLSYDPPLYMPSGDKLLDAISNPLKPIACKFITYTSQWEGGTNLYGSKYENDIFSRIRHSVSLAIY